jgi:hypothetical protein
MCSYKAYIINSFENVFKVFVHSSPFPQYIPLNETIHPFHLRGLYKHYNMVLGIGLPVLQTDQSLGKK